MYVSRDPFARQELHKTVVRNEATVPQHCEWCGDRSKKLYQYRVEPDAGRAYEIEGLFCSKSCMKAYHS